MLYISQEAAEARYLRTQMQHETTSRSLPLQNHNELIII